MVSRADIQDVCEQLVRQFRPEKVILFGSYAKGDVSADSDVDLMVVMPFEGSPAYKAAELSQAVPHRFPIDLLVRTPQQIEQRLALNDFFIRDILNTGHVLYDASDPRVG
ncbi:MAG: nucleotidyltransferase domain-containing protein [Phycisphaeraceae bacterium]|nr:nucleotidyltransferase domain-containing protein [Phycisphaeraceae bacterium]